jgi:hypothetical protein
MVEAKLGKLRALPWPSARDDKDVALLSELLSLPSFAADLNLSPQCKREESLTTLSVPATLHASLMARLDRLGPIAKEVAQIGAIIGREFGYALHGQTRRRVRAGQ